MSGHTFGILELGFFFGVALVVPLVALAHQLWQERRDRAASSSSSSSMSSSSSSPPASSSSAPPSLSPSLPGRADVATDTHEVP
jgi:hypothetical protein